jgi:hypothetical protein
MHFRHHVQTEQAMHYVLGTRRFMEPHLCIKLVPDYLYLLQVFAVSAKFDAMEQYVKFLVHSLYVQDQCWSAQETNFKVWIALSHTKKGACTSAEHNCVEIKAIFFSLINRRFIRASTKWRSNKCTGEKNQ